MAVRALLLIAALGLALPVPASAYTLDGVSLPDTVQVGTQTLQLNGVAQRVYPFPEIDIYVAALYLVTQSHDANAILASTTPKEVRLAYQHSGTKAQVEAQLRKGEVKNCGGGCPPQAVAELDRLVAASPAVKPGDVTTYVFTSGGLQALLNGQAIFTSNSAAFARGFLAAFIGANPPSAALRDGLLGLPRQ